MSVRDNCTGVLCTHGETVTKPAPAGSNHYMGAYCAQCGLHLAWLPKPETIERRKPLERLAALSQLTAFERSFLQTLIGQKGRMSPRQSDVFKDICERYGERSVT